MPYAEVCDGILLRSAELLTCNQTAVASRLANRRAGHISTVLASKSREGCHGSLRMLVSRRLTAPFLVSKPHRLVSC